MRLPLVLMVMTALALLAFGSYALAQGTPTWIQLFPTGTAPAPRTDSSAVYDPGSNRMVVFGGNSVGCSFSPSLNDTWVLTNANGLLGSSEWIQLFPSGGPPPVRRAHSATYDAVSNRMMVFGGDPIGCAASKYNDVWILTNASGLGGASTWTQLAPVGGPPPARSDHSQVYDAATNRMTVFGGFGPSGNLSDVWVLTNANGLGGASQWIQLSPSGGPPSAKALHAAAYDAATNRMIVFGGWICCSGPFFNEAWILTNANGLGGAPQWIQLSPTGAPPSPRSEARAAYDPATNRMVIFGGSNTNEVWVLTDANGLGGTPAWIQLAPSGAAPAPRGGVVQRPTATYDQAANRMTIFGGKTSIGLQNDVWVLILGNGPVGAVGGIVDLPVADNHAATSEPRTDSIGYFTAFAAFVGAALIAGGWYARRRWLA